MAAAQNTLKATDGFEFDDEDVVEGYDTDKGFRHPGALHTDEDFERIRQQLKDGNAKVIAAYNVLKNAAYSQSNAATYPVETIVRGGGVGENYINAARGATIAYQNALRWKIDRSEEHARHAVDVLMAWAHTTKAIGGDSNYALAAGLYGYAFTRLRGLECRRLCRVQTMDAQCMVSFMHQFHATQKRDMGKPRRMGTLPGPLLVELGTVQRIGPHEHRHLVR